MNTNFFSYHSPEITVSKDMCDYNGHMNVTYYYKLFDSVYSSFYIEKLGFDNEYLKSGFSTFTLEDSIRYLREFKLNDKVRPFFELHNANEKMMHFVGVLLNENNEIAAIFETVLGHVNLKIRKITAFSDEKCTFLQNYIKQNKSNEDLPFEIRLKIKSLRN